MNRDPQSQLAHWEADSSLFEPQNVRQRLIVLDQLDHFNGLDEFRPFPRNLTIAARTDSLRTRLEAANSALCNSIRSQIQRGICPPTLAADLRTENPHSPMPGLGYDFLDELVSGILQLRAPDETNIALDPEMVFYQPTPARHILQLIAVAAFSSSDVLVDIGSGLGHVPLIVSILTGIRAIGIELNPSYVASARECAQNLGLERAAFIHEDARTADLADATVFYLYTPFTGLLFQSVVARLQREAAARSIRIATLGPCTNGFANESWLAPTSEPDPDRISLFVSRD